MAKTKKVLVINDEDDTNMLIANVLKNKGYLIENASYLLDGKAIFDLQKPDLLFLDINLPDGNGLNCIDYFKQGVPLVKICVISAEDDIRKAYDYKADSVLSKPFSLTQILEKTKELIG